jgi:hypothetical protein
MTYASLAIEECSEITSRAFVAVFDPGFQFSPWMTEEFVEKDACSLDYPSLSLLAPPNFIRRGSAEEFCEVSAEFFSEISVGYTEQNLSMVFVNI